MSELRAGETPRERSAGFTLLELVVAMAVFGLVALGVYGVLVLGARSASSGERVSEQARRFRVATELVARQIAAAECVRLPSQDEAGLGDEGDAATSEPFFFGDNQQVEFVTTAPQRPDASGMAIVRYWLEDGMLRMSEKPVFTAYADTKKMKDDGAGEDALVTTLLYDVDSVTFSYLRESDTDEWQKEWVAADEGNLPACVRVEIAPASIGGPDVYHEMPIMKAVLNQISGGDDCRARRSRSFASDNAGNDFESPPTQHGGRGGSAGSGGASGEDDSPAMTIPDISDDEEE